MRINPLVFALLMMAFICGNALAIAPTNLNYSYQIPVNSFSITVPNWANELALNPAGTLASGTITMPQAPTDGEVLTIASTQTITSLTHNANTGQTIVGALTTLPANTSATWTFNSGTGAWMYQGATSSSITGDLSINSVSYQPGLLTTLNATKAAFYKFSKATTVDNIEGSANTFSCVGNPTVTVFECGTSTTCASSPVTIGTVTLTAAGAVVDGTINSAAITAGDYVAFAETAGTCASSDIAVTAQTHSN